MDATNAALAIDEQARTAAEEGRPFLFSVIMAIYNAETDLAESIESVLGQTLGMRHIELVLVDDGSTDGSAALCRSYAERYPDNIVFIAKENGGASSARNAGLAVARGKYVNFLDSDDKWTPESFEQALAFLSAHPDVRMAASKYTYFGRRNEGHRLNYKFERDDVVDLHSTYDYPQLSASTCFFHASVLEGRAFSEQLAVSEDALLVNQILLDEMRYGVMSGPEYLYRLHEQRGSAIDTMKDNPSWYFDTPELCYRHLFDLSREKHGTILPFIQFTVMYDLQWRIRAHVSARLDDAQVQRYRDLLVGLLRDIDDRIISEQRTISIDQVAYAFTLKYGTDMDDVLDHLSIEDGWLVAAITDDAGSAHSIKLRPIEALSDRLTIERFGYDGANALVEGYITSFRFRPTDIALHICANNTPVPVVLDIGESRKPVTPFGEDIVGKTDFACLIPLGAGQEVRLKAALALLGTAERPARFTFGDEAGLPSSYEDGAFALSGNALFRMVGPGAFVIRALGAADDSASIAAAAEAYKDAAAASPHPRNRPAAWHML